MEAQWEKCVGFIKNDDSEQLKKEIDSNKMIVAFRNSPNHTLLMIAAECGAYLCAQILIQNGADVNVETTVGEPALTWAVSGNHFEMAKLLLENDANLSYRDLLFNVSSFGYAMEKDLEYRFKWFVLFEKYKDQMDDEDLDLYYQMRIPTLLGI